MASGSLAGVIDDAAGEGIMVDQAALADMMRCVLGEATLAAIVQDCGDEGDGARWLSGAAKKALNPDY